MPIARPCQPFGWLVLLRDSTASHHRSRSGAALSSMERALARREARSQVPGSRREVRAWIQALRSSR
ncbi:hypothetical protein AVL59_22505 [Streptomyces griseochromogenes]|uniref:Uncharacterized protein n=1 Tax=Streptomyces griseochromogenes TaxID=68214 RepID=A0A1B1AZN0_9ACTN|nr:hypothetical protein AVL59_22505 [Streptomyces griseochromogenes]